MNRQDPLRDELLAIAAQLAAHSTRITLVRHEQDTTADPEPEAQEFIKIDGQRVGRDIRLYAFMAEIGGPGVGLADFGELLLACRLVDPPAFEAVRDQVVALGKFVPEDTDGMWASIWTT